MDDGTATRERCMALREGSNSFLLAIFQLLLIPQLGESQQEGQEAAPENQDTSEDFKPWAKSNIFGSQRNRNNVLNSIASPTPKPHRDWI